ncbi:MAG TPA: hypothetical protein VFO74_12365 [Pseudolabrys sp.]|nr:hypothetical protein [Pseudolabrys sp.]
MDYSLTPRGRSLEPTLRARSDGRKTIGRRPK